MRGMSLFTDGKFCMDYSNGCERNSVGSFKKCVCEPIDFSGSPRGWEWVNLSTEQYLFCQTQPGTLADIALCHKQLDACKNNSLGACDACFKTCQFASTWLDDFEPMLALRDECGDALRALCAKPTVVSRIVVVELYLYIDIFNYEGE